MLISSMKKITLDEGKELIESEHQTSNILMTILQTCWKNIDPTHDKVSNIIQKYEKHASVLKIREIVDGNQFQFMPNWGWCFKSG